MTGGVPQGKSARKKKSTSNPLKKNSREENFHTWMGGAPSAAASGLNTGTKQKKYREKGESGEN